MGLVDWAITHIAPLFLISSPITSYADQIHSIHRTKSSAGFSLDIPLIMLLASILKIFYWLGARYDLSLLIQALLMIGMQATLLHVALENRAPHLPTAASSTMSPTDDKHNMASAYAAPQDSTLTVSTLLSGTAKRPFDFWQWTDSNKYWMFLASFTAVLVVLQVLFGSITTPSPYGFYTTLQSIVALTIEAILPLPQISANHRSKSCRGFRISVLANWLIGDAFKMVFFFYKSAGDVPWAFKICGIFQACCDLYLGYQYFLYGDGTAGAAAWESMESGFAGLKSGRGRGLSLGKAKEMFDLPWMPGPKGGGELR